MKFKKILAVICIFLIGSIIFSGCANVGYSLILKKDGQVEERFFVELDKSKIELAGYNYQDAYDEVYSYCNQAITNMNSNINYFKYSSQYFEFLAIYGQLQPNQKAIKCGVVKYSETQIIAYVSFGSTYVRNAYNAFIKANSGTGETTEEEPRIEDKFLYTKTVDSTENPFSDIEDSQFASDFLSYFDGETNGSQKFELSDVKYTFLYGIKSNKIYTNSNRTTRTEDGYLHEWDFDYDKINTPIETYTITIKPVAWYLLALGLTVVFTLVITIIAIVQKKSKKIQISIDNKLE